MLVTTFCTVPPVSAAVEVQSNFYCIHNDYLKTWEHLPWLDQLLSHDYGSNLPCLHFVLFWLLEVFPTASHHQLKFQENLVRGNDVTFHTRTILTFQEYSRFLLLSSTRIISVSKCAGVCKSTLKLEGETWLQLIQIEYHLLLTKLINEMNKNITHLTTVLSNAALPSLWKHIITLVVGKSRGHDLDWHLHIW